MKILIIGSKGFIGSHLYNYFSSQRSFVCYAADVVVDYNDAYYSLMDASNSDFNEVFQSLKFDYCINCSGAASVPDSLIHPLRDYTLNTVNVFKILEAIRKYAPECKFINLSSAAVYGNPEKLPIVETQKLIPISPYGLHKLQAEQICNSYYNNFRISTCSARIFSAYGPGLAKQLFWDLYQKAKGNSSVTLFGTGNETRDFIYIGDIVSALHAIIENNYFNGLAINVANGEQCSVKNASELFYKAIGWNGNIQFTGDVRSGDPLFWEADISILKQFGYKKNFDMENGLNNYAQWLKGKD